MTLFTIVLTSCIMTSTATYASGHASHPDSTKAKKKAPQRHTTNHKAMDGMPIDGMSVKNIDHMPIAGKEAKSIDGMPIEGTGPHPTKRQPSK